MPASRDNESQFRSLLRAFVRTFPPLKIILYINDLICYLFSLLIDAVSYLLRNSYKFTLFIGSKIFKPVHELVSKGCSKLLLSIPGVEKFKENRERAKYQRLDKRRKNKRGNQQELHQEPIPYSDQLIKRSITYHGGLLLALFLYLFIYFVLIKHHTYTTISVAFLLLLVYLILIENSHNLRSILMLCLPVMFTNRGRALIFCGMLTLLSSGPIKSLQHNVKEIHTSLNCCKQYLVVRTDKYVSDSVVNKLVRVEEVILDLVANIKQFAGELKNKFDGIIQLALTTEQFVIDTIRKLRQILNLCNHHSNELHTNCIANINRLFVECRNMFNPFRFQICGVFNKLRDICDGAKLPQVLCELPQHVVEFFERTIGRKLAEYVTLIENEFYVDIDVKRQYAYNVTKSKSFAKVTDEIKFDVGNKFWYVHLIRRVFNLISLILVLWIFSTATIYHMHYLSEIRYDNMYLDERLNEIEDLRKMGVLKLKKQRTSSIANDANDREIKRNELYDQGLEYPTVRSIDSSEGAPQALVFDLNNNALDHNANSLKSIRSDETLRSIDEDKQLRERELADEFDPLVEPQESEDTGTTIDDEPKTVRSLDSDDDPGQNPKMVMEKEKNQEKENDDKTSDGKKPDFLFPMTSEHERHYLRPFSLHMNKIEMSKLYWSGLVWLVIMGYIGFFLVIDFAFYQLVHFLVETLREILFTSDLPLIDAQSEIRNANGEANVIKYNRTYLNTLRKQRQMQLPIAQQSDSIASIIERHKHNNSLSPSSVRDFYDRLMLSIEREIPDDVAILESLEECLPKPQMPVYNTYKLLLYLALITFGAVIVEAYALRTRHCIANLYYPRRARQRALWLYRKLLSEKPKYDEMEDTDHCRKTDSTRRKEGEVRGRFMEVGFKLLNEAIKR